MLREPTTKLFLAFANISDVGTYQLPSKDLVLQSSILNDA